jgi:hypothetical protein
MIVKGGKGIGAEWDTKNGEKGVSVWWEGNNHSHGTKRIWISMKMVNELFDLKLEADPSRNPPWNAMTLFKDKKVDSVKIVLE